MARSNVMPGKGVSGSPKRPNGFLACLPRKELARLQAHFEPIELPLRRVLYEENQPIEYVHFLHRGVASLVRRMTEGVVVEIATIGPEGMIGIPVALGASEMAHQAFMQVPGEGVRISSDAFVKVLKQSPALQRYLMRYALALLTQVATSAACNRAHTVEQRCARWLLVTRDRVEGDTFPLTQEFLGQMLGVRRPTVSIAAGLLQKAKLITYVRGKITILDRRGLETMSCECYRVIAEEYKKMLG